MFKVYGIMVLTMFFWGVNVSLLKMLVVEIPPFLMQGVRIFIAGITLFLLLFILKKKIYYKEMPWKWVFVACLIGVIIHHSLLAIGIEKTSAIKTSLILGLLPLLTAIIAVITRATSLTKIKLIGFILGFVGIVVAVVDNVSNLTTLVLGDLYVLLSIVMQAISFFIIRKISLTIPPITLTAYILTIGSAMMILVSLVTQPQDFLVFTELDGKLWGVFIFSAVFATAVGHSLYNSMIKKLGAAETAIFTNLSTIFALLGAVVILRETLHGTQIIGCLLIVIGVLIGTGAIEEWTSKRKFKQTDGVLETPIK